MAGISTLDELVSNLVLVGTAWLARVLKLRLASVGLRVLDSDGLEVSRVLEEVALSLPVGPTINVSSSFSSSLLMVVVSGGIKVVVVWSEVAGCWVL